MSRVAPAFPCRSGNLAGADAGVARVPRPPSTHPPPPPQPLPRHPNMQFLDGRPEVPRLHLGRLHSATQQAQRGADTPAEPQPAPAPAAPRPFVPLLPLGQLGPAAAAGHSMQPAAQAPRMPAAHFSAMDASTHRSGRATGREEGECLGAPSDRALTSASRSMLPRSCGCMPHHSPPASTTGAGRPQSVCPSVGPVPSADLYRARRRIPRIVLLCIKLCCAGAHGCPRRPRSRRPAG